MRVLKTLHEQGADFSKTLQHLDAVQGLLKESLSAHGVTLATVSQQLFYYYNYN